MEDIERFIKISQQKRLLNQRKLKNLDDEPDYYKKLMRELQDLRGIFCYFYFLLVCKKQLVFFFFNHFITITC